MHTLIRYTTSTHTTQEEIARLSAEIALILEQVLSLKYTILPALHTEYDALFGTLQNMIQEKQLEECEYRRYAELMMTKQQRGEQLTQDTLHTIQTIVRQEFRRIRTRLHQARSKTTEQHTSASVSSVSHSSDTIGETHKLPEITRVYKALAKKLHPDSSEKIELAEQYWHIVQDLYGQKNLSQLRDVLNVVESRSDGAQSTIQALSASALEQQHRIMTRRLARAHKKLADLQRDTLYSIGTELHTLDWQAQHRIELEQQHRAIEKNIRDHQIMIESICARFRIQHWTLHRASDTQNSSTEEYSMFDSAIAQSMYFG